MVALVEEYLALRRQLGFELHSPGQQLLGFARYADQIGHRGPITVELAVRWARLPEGTKPSWWARRLQIVRGFAQHRSLFDPGTEIPPAACSVPCPVAPRRTSIPRRRSLRSCSRPPSFQAYQRRGLGRTR
jgi:hypothetical protein